ncbi:P2X purinoceptor 7-like [Bombina bombina]|uniref:P2X purinoceptor 7-like n=1 Tax=Bombina bombina TaxID=8345 RepID=UPI00235A9F71|nr:P2X purinoceptor 7-like [Bombina bombina]
MASSSEEESTRTLMDLSQHEVGLLMQQLMEERNSEPLLFDVSQTHMWDPLRNRERELDTTTSDTDSEYEYEETQDLQGLQEKSWCSCGNCILMPTVVESICCQESDKVRFHIPEGGACICDNEYSSDIINREHLERLNKYTNSNGPMRFAGGQVLTERAYRKIAYRAYSTWIHDYLGPKERKPIPSCMVKSIRLAFPAPDNVYVGFHYADEDGPAFEMILD